MSSVKLQIFNLLAYRSCKNARFLPTPNVTAIIGPNGAGKTNLMQGIRLLSLPIRPHRFLDNDELYTSKCSIRAEFKFRQQLIKYKASIKYTQNELGRDDVVSFEEKWNFPGTNAWLRDEAFHAYPETFRFISGKNNLVRVLPSRGKPKLPKDIVQAYDAIERLRRGIKYYSASQFTNPSLCPTSFDVDEDGELIREGTLTRRHPHTSFIYELYRLQQVNQKIYDTFLSLVDGRGVRLIDKLKWSEFKFSNPIYEVRAGGKVVTKTRDRIMVIPTVHVGAAELSFSQLSEGTFRTLAMIFYIVTDKSELLLMEEPEVCVHHGLLNSVIEIIKEYSRTKQIIVSTHSDSVIDNLDPSQVMIVTRVKDRGTVVNPISKVMSRDGYRALKLFLSDVGTLGEFWRHSGFNNETNEQA